MAHAIAEAIRHAVDNIEHHMVGDAESVMPSYDGDVSDIGEIW